MKLIGLVSALLLVLVTPYSARADRDPGNEIRAALTGYQEVPAVNTVARGRFRATISDDQQSIQLEETYDGLQGMVTQSHIHVAQLSVNGSVTIWLCGTPSNPGPAGTQTCPQSGSVSATVTAADVVAGSTTSQQLPGGDLAATIKAIRAGAAYANVHTDLSPGGEIRGQLHVVEDQRGGDRDR
jgi:CHRD domain